MTSRQLALEQELEHVTGLNAVVDTLLETVRHTQQSIAKTKLATDSTSVLLEDWTKILNQTRFATAVLQDPKWEGPEDGNGQGDQDRAQEAALEAELQRVERENKELLQKLKTLPGRDAKRVKR